MSTKLREVHIDMSLEDQVNWLCCLQKKRTDWDWSDCYIDALFAFLESSLVMKDEHDSCISTIDSSCRLSKDILFYPYGLSSYSFNPTPHTLDEGYVSIKVDLTYSKSKLLKAFEALINEYQLYSKRVKKKKQVRAKHRYDLYPRYLRVYDMREKDGMTYKAIAQKFISEEIFIDDFDKDPRGPEIKIIQYYQEAKRIIDNVVDF